MVFLNFNIAVFSSFFLFFLNVAQQRNSMTLQHDFLYNKVCILLSFVSLLCSCLKIE